MRISNLLARNLKWYWRTNLAVVLGVAAATGVIGGALLVGESVRGSLRGLVLERLGRVEYFTSRAGFFREQMQAGAPLIVLNGGVWKEDGARRLADVEVYGADARLWKLQGWPGKAPEGDEVVTSAALARELGAKPGDSVLLRLPKPSAIPYESLHGRKENTGKSVRLAFAGPGREFSLRAQQGDVRAVYVGLERLQRELGVGGKVNTVVSERAEQAAPTMEDYGLKLRNGVLESDSALISDAVVEAVKPLAPHAVGVLSYLANAFRANGNEVPYSVVTALDGNLAPVNEDGIVLNEWTARELKAKPGDAVEIEYYAWKSDGTLRTERAQFKVERVCRLLLDTSLTPEYPGITESTSLRDWDPPFPLDLKRVRPVDEQYWENFRTTPKAYVKLSRGRALWGTRFGSLTSLRVGQTAPEFAQNLARRLPPFEPVAVKQAGLAAAQGSTDFGEYFVYFSFFLMVSALLLTGLFFRLGVEQRMREIGVLRALGFSRMRIQTLFLMEGTVLAVAGAVVGIVAAVAFGGLMVLGLRTWWVDAVGTRAIGLHASAGALFSAGVAGVMAGLASVGWTLRGMRDATPRGLMSGVQRADAGKWRWISALVAASLAVVCSVLGGTGGFFGAGASLLTAAMLGLSWWLHSTVRIAVRGQATLGLRNLAYRPGRSVLCVALIASATFVILSLDAFRQSTPEMKDLLIGEAALPVISDPGALAPAGVKVEAYRVHPGDDASCLNLYAPRNPRVIAGARKVPPVKGAVAAVADANSLTYVLHRKLNEAFEAGGVRYQVVEAPTNSLFQSELTIGETDFLRLFPDDQGFRMFVFHAPASRAAEIEEAFREFGMRVERADERLAKYHRIENTYLSTFRVLGALGLVLGTIGLAAILMRNVLERRRELALLRAVGYTARDISRMVLAENVGLLVAGLATGAVCAAVAVRGGHAPVISGLTLLAVVLAVGIAASWAATAAVLRSAVLDSLRAE